MLQDYKPQLDTPKRQGRLALVYLQAAIGASGAPTVDTEDSSPRVTLTRNTTGQYTMTFPKCVFVHIVGHSILLAEATGVGGTIRPESLVAASGGTGTLTFETTTDSAPGTAADPADGSRIFITLLVGN
jgi:hypothetical protein